MDELFKYFLKQSQVFIFFYNFCDQNKIFSGWI